jgi:DNA-directed RNA polymerase subunit RPC12/RpoP
MDLTTVYCPGCNHKVRLTVTPEHRTSHATLPDGGEVVCLDFGEGCTEGSCPLTGRPGIVMGVRLARSTLPHETRTLHATCSGCGDFTEMEVLDDRYAVCEACGTTNTYVVVPVDDESAITLTGG